MIILYPMLVSNTVSANVIPGICKNLEKFVLTYRLSKSMAQIQKMMEDAQLEDIIGDYLTEESDPSITGKGAHNTKPRKGLKPKEDKSVDLTFDVKTMQSDVASVEPTFVTIEVKKNSVTIQQIIGIKVIPFGLTSDASMANLLMSDAAVNKLESKFIALGRDIKRSLWKSWNAIKSPLPVIGGSVMAKGEARHDIIMARSKYRENIFACMNYMDLKTDFFRQEGPKKIDQLQNMGWNSLIFPDDVQKRVYFCMQEFGGICSVVPYNMIYSAVGKLNKAAYEELEDVRKTTSPFFRNKVSVDKMMKEGEESNIEHLINSRLLETEIRVQTESLDGLAKNFKEAIKTGSMQFSKIKNVIQSKDVDKLKTISKFLPKVSLDSVMKYASEKVPGFDKYYKMSEKVYTNSIGSKIGNHETGIKLLSILAATRAATSKNPKMAFIEIIKKSTNDMEEKIDDSMPAATMSDYVIGGIIYAGLTSIILSIYIGAILTFNDPILLTIVLSILSILLYSIFSEDKK